MTKAQKAIQELEAELNEHMKVAVDMDLDKVLDAKIVFSGMSFYQAQAFKKIFERLDEIEAKIK